MTDLCRSAHESPVSRQPQNKGFTLIELLVVMSLLSVIMVAIGSSLRTMAQTETRVDALIQRTEDIRVVRHFLTQALGRIDASKVRAATPTTEPSVQFAVESGSISWVGIMPARYGIGGRYFFRLTQELNGSTNDLILRYVPWAMQTDFPDWTQAESHTLAKNITDFKVEVDGLPTEIQTLPSNWPRGWQSIWPVKDHVPQRVRLVWTDPKGAWPPLVIALIPTSQSRPGSGGFVTGGSTR